MTLEEKLKILDEKRSQLEDCYPYNGILDTWLDINLLDVIDELRKKNG